MPCLTQKSRHLFYVLCITTFSGACVSAQAPLQSVVKQKDSKPQRTLVEEERALQAARAAANSAQDDLDSLLGPANGQSTPVANTQATNFGTSGAAPAAPIDDASTTTPAGGATPPVATDTTIDPAAQTPAVTQGAALQAIPDLDRSSDVAVDSATVIKALEQKIADLEKRLAHLEYVADAQSDKLTELAQAMQSTPQLSARENPDEAASQQPKLPLRPEAPQAEGPTPTPVKQGRVVFDNQTGAIYSMIVNGRSYVVRPGKTEVVMAVGPVVTELAGYEAPRAWRDSDWRKVGDEYRLAIQIQ